MPYVQTGTPTGLAGRLATLTGDRRLVNGSLERGRGSALDEILAILVFMALPMEMPVLAMLRLPLAGMVLLLAALYWRDTVPILRRGWIFLLVPAFCLLSVAWSPLPPATLRFTAYMTVPLIAAIVLASRLSHRQVVVAVFLAKFAFAIAGLVFLEKAFVGGVGGGWAILGVYPQKNVLSTHTITMMIAATAILLDGRYRSIWRLLALPGLCLGLFYIANARSATGILLTVAGIGAMASLAGIWRPAAQVRGLRPLMACVAVLAVTLAVMVFASMARTDPWTFLLDLFGKESSLNGRTVIWTHARELISQNPLFGVGAGAFWQPGVGAARQIAGMFSADPSNVFNFHNAFFEIVVQTGLIGLAVYLVSVGTALKTLVLDWWRRQKAIDGFFVVLALIILARSQTESEAFHFMGLSMLVFWTGVFLAIRRRVTGSAD